MIRSDDGARRLGLRGLPAGKGVELIGLLLLAIGALLSLSLLSYQPSDASFLRSGATSADTENLIGPVGAEVAAAGYGVLGLAVVAVALAILGLGYRLVRARGSFPSLLQGAGIVVALAALPTLIDLAVGDVQLRGEALVAGGLVGRALSGGLQSQLGAIGATVIALFALLFGIALTMRGTFEEWLVRVAGQLKGPVAFFASKLGRRRKTGRKKKAGRRAGKAATEPVVDSPLQELKLRRSAAQKKVDGGRPEVTATPVAAPETHPPASAASGSADDADGQAAAGPELPPIDLLYREEVNSEVDEDEVRRLGELICARCAEFGVEGTIEGISPGPVITVFEFQPAPGIKVAQIINLQDDLALSLKAEAIRIDRMPGRSTLGIEVPNTRRTVIPLGSLLDAPGFRESKSPLTMALGRTLRGEPYYADLTKMPHLLVAGATGAGKSVGLQGMLTSILYKVRSDEVQFILIDPKRIELGVYADIPHLKTAVVVEPKQAANALRWAVGEMERRYRLLAEVHVRSIAFYNEAISDPDVARRLRLRDEEADEPLEARDFEPLPYYVIVIDELADLMMVASSEVETSIARLAQMARAVGIHLIVATQRPSVDVLTGTIKANFPCRISYAAATRHDSRTILDQVGAEKLLGKGDMLFMPPGSGRTIRLHGAYVTEQETAALVRWLKRQGQPNLDPAVLEPPVEDRSAAGSEHGGGDVLYDEAARLVVAERMGSASFLQRRMRVGFSRASRLVDLMEQDGILGPAQGSKPREVLVPPDFFEEIEQSQIAFE
ncbi:MAG: DNA translocase FtsK 4TM domain-containing protein [Acidobacteria bacterium]|nr:DNA translocase FtsK 4TM domain-containing protein [Acidobacteriota bacterium]